MELATFPLSRLPSEVLKVVSACMKPTELFRLSLVSKKAHQLAKTLRKKPKNLELFFCSHASMYINYECGYGDYLFFVKSEKEEPAPEGCELLKIRGYQVKVKYFGETDRMELYWDEDRYVGLGNLHNIVMNFYKVEIYHLEVSGDHRKFDSQLGVHLVNKLQLDIGEVLFFCEKSGDDELEEFLDEIEDRIAGALSVKVKTSEDFQYDFSQPLTANTIHFVHASWVSTINLYNMNSSILWLNETRFSSDDIHYFLKNCMIGGNSNLTHLVLELPTEIDKDAIFNELIIEIRVEEIEFELAGSIKMVYDSSYELKRLEDGAIASILLRDEDPCDFRMIVWNPDQDEEQF
ncbi:unnamed protein product [Caenorhabditis brenneri]